MTIGLTGFRQIYPTPKFGWDPAKSRLEASHQERDAEIRGADKKRIKEAAERSTKDPNLIKNDPWMDQHLISEVLLPLLAQLGWEPEKLKKVAQKFPRKCDYDSPPESCKPKVYGLDEEASSKDRKAGTISLPFADEMREYRVLQAINPHISSNDYQMIYTLDHNEKIQMELIIPETGNPVFRYKNSYYLVNNWVESSNAEVIGLAKSLFHQLSNQGIFKQGSQPCWLPYHSH